MDGVWNSREEDAMSIVVEGEKRGLSMIRALPHGRDHPTVCLSSHGATHLKLGMGYPTSTELACVKKRVQRIDGVCPLFTETPFVLLKRI
jgi:hypothetical protein